MRYGYIVDNICFISGADIMTLFGLDRPFRCHLISGFYVDGILCPERCYQVLFFKGVPVAYVAVLKTLRCRIRHGKGLLIVICMVFPFIWHDLIGFFYAVILGDIVSDPEQIINKGCAAPVIICVVDGLAETEVPQPVQYRILLT